MLPVLLEEYKEEIWLSHSTIFPRRNIGTELTDNNSPDNFLAPGKSSREKEKVSATVSFSNP